MRFSLSLSLEQRPVAPEYLYPSSRFGLADCLARLAVADVHIAQGAVGVVAMRYARRTDDNQKAIVQALRAAGWTVHDLSHIGHGVPDLYAWKGNYKAFFIEIKNGNKPPGKRRLTKSENWFIALLQRAGARVLVVDTPEQAERL